MNLRLAKALTIAFAGFAMGCHSDLVQRFEGATSELESQVCADGRWDHDGNSFTVCAPLRECAPGTYVLNSGSAAMDRSCAPCPEGSFSADINSAICHPWRRCVPGTVVDLAGTGSSDATCKGCPSGTFSDKENGLDCVPWTDCQPEQFISLAGTGSSNRACTSCPDKTSSSGINAGRCVRDNECPQGTVVAGADNCKPCSSGSECSGGASPELACGEDFWDNDLDPATPCVLKTLCSPGQFVQFSGSTTSDRICAPCGVGEYSSTANAQSCSVWTTCAAPSFFERSSPSTTVDRICGECTAPAETFGDNQARCTGDSYGLVDGELVIDAQVYTSTNANGSSAGWSPVEAPGASGGQGMELSAPDESTAHWLENVPAIAPRLSYTVTFEQSGTYTAYIRGSAGNGGGHADSCWGGIDNVPMAHEFDFDSAPYEWSWDAQSFTVSAGVHSFNIWPREDGVRVDKIVINNTGVAPTGEGPGVSPLH